MPQLLFRWPPKWYLSLNLEEEALQRIKRLYRIDLLVNGTEMVQHVDVNADHGNFVLDLGRITGDMGWVSLKIVLNRRMMNLDQTVVCVNSHEYSNILKVNGLDDFYNAIVHIEDLLVTSVGICPLGLRFGEQHFQHYQSEKTIMK